MKSKKVRFKVLMIVLNFKLDILWKFKGPLAVKGEQKCRVGSTWVTFARLIKVKTLQKTAQNTKLNPKNQTFFDLNSNQITYTCPKLKIYIFN